MQKTLVALALAAFCLAAGAADTATTLTIAVDKTPALVLQLPAGWTSNEGKDGRSILVPPKRGAHLQLWSVAAAKTVAEALPLVPGIIKGEVTDYKAVETKDITVAGQPAKHLIGTGTEADDGDPSNAEVFLFAVGGKVFLLCAHGEGVSASRQRAAVLDLLATAKQP